MPATTQPSDPDDPLGDEVKLYLSPYEEWNFGNGKPYAFPAMRTNMTYISAMAELVRRSETMGAGSPQTDDKASLLPDLGTSYAYWFPLLWRRFSQRFLPFVVYNKSGRTPDVEQLKRLLRDGAIASQPWTDRIDAARFRVAFPVAPSAMDTDDAGKDQTTWTPDAGLASRIGRGKRITIVGVIDDGLPFAHRHFRDASGMRSRVEFCWLQSARIGQAGGPVRFGREYTRNDIEALIRRHADEDDLYREAGALDDSEGFPPMLRRHASHGAHVMDIAAGFNQAAGEEVGEEIRIIAVQLPNTIAWDTSGFGKDMYMLSAFHYIFERAKEIADGYGLPAQRPGGPPAARLVVNFSYGFSAGRHDGGTELEAAIDELVVMRRDKEGPTALVLPAGNMFLDRLHAVIAESDFSGGRAAVTWRIQPNDRTPSYLEMWFPDDFENAGYSVELLDPHQRKVATVEIDQDQARDDGDPRRVHPFDAGKSQAIGQISVDLHRGSRWRAMIVVAPTEPDDARFPGIDAGAWTVAIVRRRRSKPLNGPVLSWIQRDADPELLRSGSRQSYFDDPRNLPYAVNGAANEQDVEASYVRRFGSLNGLATGRTSLIVAGYEDADLSALSGEVVTPASYSSAGPQRGWAGKQVDCSSLSDRGSAEPGTRAAGVRSGSVSFIRGTSAAAPAVARKLAAAFASADDADVQKAERHNYLPLLPGRQISDRRLGRKIVDPRMRDRSRN